MKIYSYLKKRTKISGVEDTKVFVEGDCRCISGNKMSKPSGQPVDMASDVAPSQEDRDVPGMSCSLHSRYN